jgi:hypothetical protein
MWDFARKNWKTNIAFQSGRTASRLFEDLVGDIVIGRHALDIILIFEFFDQFENATARVEVQVDALDGTR